LNTERLILRPFSADDFEIFAEMNGDPDVMRYIAPVQDKMDAFRSLCATIGHWTVRGYGAWCVVERASGQQVGRAGIIDWFGHPGREIGYALRKSAMGKGYATEAAGAALKYAHDVVGARGLYSVIHPDNKPSIHVAEKLGARYHHETKFKGETLHVYQHRDP
jgi:RimJ/RimL family protein N-acetyltransferase